MEPIEDMGVAEKSLLFSTPCKGTGYICCRKESLCQKLYRFLLLFLFVNLHLSPISRDNFHPIFIQRPRFFLLNSCQFINFTSPEGYGFIEFRSRAGAENALQTYNGTLMPNSEQNFRLNWATLGAGERRNDDTPDYTIFVGDLAADVSDYVLQETFKNVYPSCKGAKVVTDGTTGNSKGYGFVSNFVR